MRFTYPARRRQPAYEAVGGIDLQVNPGQTVALLGPNGSGKSTLMRLTCCMLRPDAGSIDVFGSSRPREIRPRLGVVFQAPGLDRRLTVYENLRDQATFFGIPRRQARSRIDAALGRAGLSDRRGALVKTLSGGLTRRADLVRATLHRPRLLLLDEPTTGLDPVARSAFLKQLLERSDESPSIVVLSTHLVDEAERLDRVVLLHQGKVVADGDPAALRARVRQDATIVRARCADPPAAPGLTWRRADDGRFEAAIADEKRVGDVAERLSEAGIAFSVRPPGSPTISEVFEQLTGASLDDRRSPQPAEVEP